MRWRSVSERSVAAENMAIICSLFSLSMITFAGPVLFFMAVRAGVFMARIVEYFRAIISHSRAPQRSRVHVFDVAEKYKYAYAVFKYVLTG